MFNPHKGNATGPTCAVAGPVSTVSSVSQLALGSRDD